MRPTLKLLVTLSLSLPIFAAAKPVIRDVRTGHKREQILFTRTLTEGKEVMKIDYFQLAREDMASQAINKITMRLLNRYSFSCGDGKDADEEGVISLADRNSLTVSLNVATSWFCGAYPDGVGSMNTYELASGRRIYIARELAGDTERAKVKKLLVEKFRQQAAADKDHADECSEFTNDDKFDLEENSFGVQGSNVVFSLSNSLPHVAKACGDDVTLSIKEIVPMLKPDSLLRKLAK